jgi:murein DD-endopeptidase MepM/ murein hydrolase activator NlpD
VTIDHGQGLWTTYSFLKELRARQDDDVSRGEVIGTVGRGHPSSELPSHVHLSARQDGTYFDPVVLYVGNRLDDLLSLVR